MIWTRRILRWARLSKIQNPSLDSGHVDLVLLDLLIKRASGDAEALRGSLNASSFLLKDAFDVLLFELEKCEARVEEGRTNLRVTIEVKVVDGDRFLVTQ